MTSSSQSQQLPNRIVPSCHINTQAPLQGAMPSQQLVHQHSLGQPVAESAALHDRFQTAQGAPMPVVSQDSTAQLHRTAQSTVRSAPSPVSPLKRSTTMPPLLNLMDRYHSESTVTAVPPPAMCVQEPLDSFLLESPLASGSQGHMHMHGLHEEGREMKRSRACS